MAFRTDPEPSRDILVAAFNGRVFGIDRGSGTIRWEVELSGGAHVELAIDQGTVIAASHTELAFVDHATGRVLKRVEIAGDWPNRPTMLVHGSHVYVARGGELICYSREGEMLWLQPFKGKGVGSVALALSGFVRQSDATG
jgi:outer membrane protein assembly factor BamB